MGDTISRIVDNTSGTSRSIKGKDSLDGDVHASNVERFKHDLTHLFSVCFWVHWSFSQKNAVFFWSNTKFIVESVMPNFFHIIPVGHNTVFDWVLQTQNTTFGLCFVTNVGIFLSHTNHDTCVSWSTYNTWENCPGCQIF